MPSYSPGSRSDSFNVQMQACRSLYLQLCPDQRQRQLHLPSDREEAAQSQTNAARTHEDSTVMKAYKLKRGKYCKWVNAYRASGMHTPRNRSMSAWKRTDHNVRPFRQTYFWRISVLICTHRSTAAFAFEEQCGVPGIHSLQCVLVGVASRSALRLRSEAEVRSLMALCKLARECTHVSIGQGASRCPKAVD